MTKKAVALLSGGLDSILAIKLIQLQGIDVRAVNFATPFFESRAAIKAAKELSVDLKLIDITNDLLRIIKSPKYGHGKNMNPCIDCHGLMLRRAGEYMEEIGASFIITGEVLGERPMSQNKQSLSIVEKLSGYRGRVLRPLSAKLLSETLPEQEKTVDRERLLAISGRSRKPQMELAKELGIEDYPSPASGCLLTDPGFSHRLRELLIVNKEPAISDLELLKIGRHFRTEEGAKIVVGRNHKENEKLLEMARDSDICLKVKDHPGPITILGQEDKEAIKTAAMLTVRYGSARDEDKDVLVSFWKKDDSFKGEIKSRSMEMAKVDELMI